MPAHSGHLDRSHIVQHFKREVVDRVRKDEQVRMIKEASGASKGRSTS